MKIIRIDRKKNQIGDDVFTSFEEVFNYCEDMVYGIYSPKDDLVFDFKIVDSEEEFAIYARGTLFDGYEIGSIVYF